MKTPIEIIDKNTFIKDGLITVDNAIKCMQEYAAEFFTKEQVEKLQEHAYKLGIENEKQKGVSELPLPEEVEAEAKMVLATMHIKKGYGKDWTDDDLLNGLKLMASNYRKYLLKTV